MSFAPKPRAKPGKPTDTTELLDKMMDACKLPDAERRRLRALGNGQRVQRRPNAQQQAPRQYEDMLRGVALNPGIVTTRYTRTQAAITASLGPQGYDRPQFAGGPPARDNEAEKTALQMRMQYGKNAGLLGHASSAQLPPPPPPPPRVSEEAALHASISREIDERRNFISTMRAAGRGKEHEASIAAQIAERVDELKTVERLMRS